MSPTVTVVIPVYNGERFIAAAIESVLSQTWRQFELVVIDDGSEDNTLKVVRSFEDDRLRFVRQENSGLSAARNRGIAEGGGELIALLDADDEWLPAKLEKQLEVIDAQNVVYTDVMFWDESTGSTIGTYEIFDRFPRDRRKFSGNTLTPLLSQNFIHPSTVLMHRQDLEQASGFDESLPVAEDWDLWLRLAERVTWTRIEEPLVKVRRRPDSLQADTDLLSYTSSAVLQRAAKRLQQRGEFDDRKRFAVALGYFASRDAKIATTELGRAVIRKPWDLTRWRWFLASLARPILRSRRG